MAGAGSSSGGAGSAALLSPESTVGAPSEARYGGPSGLHLSPGSDGSDEPASCFDTPYSSRQPPLHYSLDRSEAAQPLRSQPHSHLGDLQIDSPGDSWPFSHTAAAHSSGHEQKDSQGLEASPAEERWPGRLQGSGGMAVRGMHSSAFKGVRVQAPRQALRMGTGTIMGKKWERAERKVDEGRRLLALLGGDAAGPIELDTAMLYSPASTDTSSHRTGDEAPPSASKAAPLRATPGSTHQDVGQWTIPAKYGEGGTLWSPSSAATERRSMSAPRERRSPQTTIPKEFRLSETSRKHSRAAAAQRILEERRRDMTFRPALLPPRPHSPALGSESTLSGEARIARLAQPRTQLWEKCAARKREEEGGELAHCTFVPKTGRGPASGPKATVARLPAPTRLYAHHDSKYRQWERLRAERDEEELRDCTFAPAVNPSAEPRTPLHRRLSELQRQRSERLARMRLAREAADADATFSPAVNDKSLRMALAKQIRELRDEVPASQRLSAARPLPAPTPDAEAGFTFAPELCRTSERLLEDSAQLPGNFFERQRFFHDLKLRRLRVLQSEEDANCTFSPDTKGQSAVILAASARSADHAERLAVTDKRRVEGARAGVAHDYYSQFSFQPAINERSRRLAKGGDRLGELTSSERRRERREAMAAEAEARMEAECTFRPRLHSRQGADQENRDPAEKGNLLRRIAEQRAERETALEQQRSRREMAELADCTFRPTRVSSAPAPPTEEVAVKGMEAYMATRQRARQLAAEQAAREEKAFILHPRDSHAPTVPQPFCLRTDLREKETEGRRLQLQAALLAESMRECTFHPNTNEALNRQLLDAILASDDDCDDARSTCSVQTL
ncbi:hypothetical protein COCSUDRAFT_39121 [Coccomyxa subellipsoidea C-169]|uniref:Uncharacterized protein n=1 Tax=Coccomyxa subellipsoidea (strain C-169) TaxID=574566 RepID=I0Z9Y7_COCSC|nr:hypothetical protein COCSUDRAFT_39121 [Coccomyxa subellipsoidea C-169]EIE27456.1 hypothetical protein COCSUDRAFT_39121 [Coccomyxa subellipsoidea C-169]|eukprot:XP_005652000.1 hypothetical protein COCSUDRAFT_39121 [Coccomyxa subellipsoidea C-169]